MKPADAVSRSSGLAPKIVDEVRELHARTVSLGRDVNGARGRRARRERRQAREAETDLLRVLGFASYEQFVGAIDGPATRDNGREPDAVAPPGLSLVENDHDEPAVADEPAAVTAPVAAAPVGDIALDARRTEAALLRVLRSERRGEPARAAADEHPADELADLHARIAVFEEELAETRFELRRVRDELRARPGAPAPSESAVGGDSSGVLNASSGVLNASAEVLNAAPEVLDALARTAAELRALGESLRAERIELAGMGAAARAEAERILEQARADAQRIRDAATAEANALVDQARADAVALTRNAISTVDGLRQLAAEERDRTRDDT